MAETIDHSKESRTADPAAPPSDPAATSNIPPSSKESPSRPSGVADLAPLEYLQKQRRGSITDPQLHAAGHGAHSAGNYNMSSYNRPAEPPVPNSGAPGGTYDQGNKQPSSDARPASSFVFGDATAHTSIPQTRDSSRAARLSKDDQDEMNVDSVGPLDSRAPQSFDYNMRRHSIADPNHRMNQDPHSLSPRTQPLTGTKRKMSTDRGTFTTVSEEIDPQLAGPGMDAEGPAPKRRGSAIDTQRIAQMSLNDRRNSVDSRGTSGPPPQWWNERRDSSASVFSNLSTTGYASSNFSESPQGRSSSMAGVSWPKQGGQGSTPGTPGDGDQNTSGGPRPMDPQLAMMGQLNNYLPDRRMSVPNVPSSTSTRPTKALRSRSRPPSGSQPNNTQSGSSTNDVTPEEPSTNSSNLKPPKEPGATPYSRSPELRVSHKLAERKRRREMKDLFDELRDHLPADRGMKASKWEILSKAIDFIAGLKQGHQEMAREIEVLRHELDATRQGGAPSFPQGASGSGHLPYPQGGPPPSTVPSQQYSMPASANAPNPQTSGPMPPPPSRPGSSHNGVPNNHPSPKPNGTGPSTPSAEMATS